MVCAAIPAPSFPSLTACLSRAGGPGRYKPKPRRAAAERARVAAPIGLPVEPQRAVNKRVRRVLASTVNGSAFDAAKIVAAWDPHAVEVEATLC